MNHPGQWKPGQSGNPSGKPPGCGQVTKLRAAIAEHIPDILERLIEQAKSGDTQAARLLIERALPALKAIELPIVLPPMAGTIVDQAKQVLASATDGALSPSEANALLAGLGVIGKLTETGELLQRIEKIEAALEKRNA